MTNEPLYYSIVRKRPPHSDGIVSRSTNKIYSPFNPTTDYYASFVVNQSSRLHSESGGKILTTVLRARSSCHLLGAYQGMKKLIKLEGGSSCGTPETIDFSHV
jgi:hypothetical protein